MESATLEVAQLLITVGALDTKKLARRSTLGEEFSLEEAVEPITRTIEFFRSIPTENLEQLPEQQLEQVKQQTLAFLSIIDRLRAFSPSKEDNPAATRNGLLDLARGTYITAFSALHPYVSFLASQQRDLTKLEEQARAATVSVTEEAQRLRELLTLREKEATEILQKVREAAAEQGVSQQAHYFKQEADKHGTAAGKWQKFTVRTAVGLGVYALGTLIFAMLYTPDTALQTAQIAVSKALIFAVIAYMLFLCARTLTGHQHNEIVNRHRENALLTFNSLAAAAGDAESRDVILNHAAGCIFGPQDTGFGKHAQSSGSSVQIVESLPRAARMLGGEAA